MKVRTYCDYSRGAKIIFYRIPAIILALLTAYGSSAQTTPGAETLDIYQRCILFGTLNAPAQKTAQEIRLECDALANDQTPENWDPSIWEEFVSTFESGEPGAITTRAELEDISKDNSFIITPHRPNYLLPFAFTRDNNLSPFEGPGVESGTLDNTEVQFQLSLKFPLLDNFIVTDSTLWMGYTIRSFWQAYNTDISRPFRETNHEPEIFWNIPSTISLLGVRNVSNEIVLNHQSNGQSGSRSRSWNRMMLASYWEKGNLGIIVKPWYRLPEATEEDPDENPDIEDYLGNFELVTNYQVGGHSLSLMLRNNLSSDNRGAAEITYSFPWLSRVDGTIKYFNGYGESLVDFDRNIERLSIGIQITDWF